MTSSRSPQRWYALAALAMMVPACSSTAPAAAVAAAPPPKDDGSAAKGISTGNAHSAAMEQLKIAAMGSQVDRQRSLVVPLPDAPRWTRVKFTGVPSLVGFRYGKEHHAIVAGYVTHVEDNQAPGACSKSFETWAAPFIEAFEVEVQHEPPKAVVWNGKIAEIEIINAKTATVLLRESYAVAYALYPAWKGACLVLGVAVPSGGDDARAREVRDRFAQEVLPKLVVTSPDEPQERY